MKSAFGRVTRSMDIKIPGTIQPKPKVLSRLLVKMNSTGRFDYHPKCGRTKLNHLMFADDVIIFAKAIPRSLVRIKDALITFSNWSGLSISEEKSAIFFGGCSESEESMLASVTSFRRGQLPFKYLGVPLQGKRLKGSDFNVIMEKMTSKIKAWSSRLLSYAGRLFLIKHVLSAIGSYWMRVMVFPKCVIKKISAICRNFLWSGAVAGKRNLVAWTEVCKPKAVGGGGGGLGLLNLSLFNKSLLLGQLWDVAQKKDSMWIKWMSSYFLKDMPLWHIVAKRHNSWVLKNLLSLREFALQCVEVEEDNSLRWRSREPSKEWSDIIWNVLAHPKHSFCAWLAVRDRLPTRTRLRGSLIGDRRCCWCAEVDEDGVHLFFQCKESPPIYSFLDLIGLRVRWSSWAEMISWNASKRWRCRSQKLVAWFIITSAIYEVWRARNRCIFEGDRDSVNAVRKAIWRMLKLKLELMKNSKTGFLCASWCSNSLATSRANV
ncbi:hypothetical protein QQ045_027314 [Rhodiola kirilowii]